MLGLTPLQAGSSQGSYRDARTGLPVYDLYQKSSQRIVKIFDEAGVDCVLFDMQDVGVSGLHFLISSASGYLVTVESLSTYRQVNELILCAHETRLTVSGAFCFLARLLKFAGTHAAGCGDSDWNTICKGTFVCCLPRKCEALNLLEVSRALACRISNRKKVCILLLERSWNGASV